MTATPTPLRELAATEAIPLLGRARDLCNAVLGGHGHNRDLTIARNLLPAIEAHLSARDEAGAVAGDERKHVICVCPDCIATPPASAGAVESCPKCGGDCGSANPPVAYCPMRDAASPPKSPSYDALLIIVQSVCGALARAGIADCDDPGEAIDVMREGYERRLAAVAPAGSGEAGACEHERSYGAPWRCAKCGYRMDEATPPVYRCDYCDGDYTDAKYCCQARREYLNAHGEHETATPPGADGITRDEMLGYVDACADVLRRNGKPIMARELSAIARRLAAVAPASDHIDAMVNRFLGWRLPDDFAPDNGISYAPIPRHPDWTHDTHPTGTNLFHAGQARAMFAHCVAAVAPAGMVLVPRKQIEELAEILGDGSTTTSSGLPVTVLELIDAQQGAAGELRRMLAAAPTPPATAAENPEAPPADVQTTITALSLVGDTEHITDAQVAAWTQEQRDQAYDWAMAVHFYASDNPDVEVPPRPDFTLATPPATAGEE